MSKTKSQEHPFWQAVYEHANFRSAFSPMRCHLVEKDALRKVCKIKSSKVDQEYEKRFGPDISFTCSVPKNSFVLTLRFVEKLSDFKTSPQGTWNIFAGLYQYKSLDEAKQIIEKEGNAYA